VTGLVNRVESSWASTERIVAGVKVWSSSSEVGNMYVSQRRWELSVRREISGVEVVCASVICVIPNSLFSSSLHSFSGTSTGCSGVLEVVDRREFGWYQGYYFCLCLQLKGHLCQKNYRIFGNRRHSRCLASIELLVHPPHHFSVRRSPWNLRDMCFDVGRCRRVVSLIFRR